MSFISPSSLPQDILFIQELVAADSVVHAKPSQESDEDDDINSSASENEVMDHLRNSSAEELDKPSTSGALNFALYSRSQLIANDSEVHQDGQNNVPLTTDLLSSESESENDSSDSDSPLPDSPHQPEVELEKLLAGEDEEDDDDEHGGTAPAPGAYFRTKHEAATEDVSVPDIEFVGAEEQLERVGEVFSIVGSDTIIVTSASGGAVTAERVLDTGTLLVFEDRRVIGLIHETFGPTSQPMYLVKFNDTFKLELETVTISRPVFHVPQRSHFVFLSHLRRFKGSDASNFHDEEPGEDEIEFSDDEAEAAYKSQKKKKRNQGRSESTPFSRSATPSQMRDQDMHAIHGNAFDAHGPYDINYGPSDPSRSAGLPYNDAYEGTEASGSATTSNNHSGTPRPQRHERGRGPGRSRPRGRGRGYGGPHGNPPSNQYGSNDAFSQRQISPTSFTIARATGQYNDGNSISSSSSMPFMPDSAQYINHSSPQIQPHINPRFSHQFVYPQWQHAPGNQYGTTAHSSANSHVSPNYGNMNQWPQDFSAQNNEYQPAQSDQR